MAESACALVMDEPPSAFESVEETGEERKTRLSVYHEIKRQLIAQGIPENEIAFVHDYDGPAAQAELSRKVNAGEICTLTIKFQTEPPVNRWFCVEAACLARPSE